jgi:hypothetical protein
VLPGAFLSSSICVIHAIPGERIGNTVKVNAG